MESRGTEVVARPRRHGGKPDRRGVAERSHTSGPGSGNPQPPDGVLLPDATGPSPGRGTSARLRGYCRRRRQAGDLARDDQPRPGPRPATVRGRRPRRRLRTNRGTTPCVVRTLDQSRRKEGSMHQTTWEGLGYPSSFMLHGPDIKPEASLCSDGQRAVARLALADESSVDRGASRWHEHGRERGRQRLGDRRGGWRLRHASSRTRGRGRLLCCGTGVGSARPAGARTEVQQPKRATAASIRSGPVRGRTAAYLSQANLPGNDPKLKEAGVRPPPPRRGCYVSPDL